MQATGPERIGDGAASHNAGYGWSMRQTLHTENALEAFKWPSNANVPRPACFTIRTGAPIRRRNLSLGLRPIRDHPVHEPKGRLLGQSAHESFFHTLKTEQVHPRVYATRHQARRDLFGYIEGFYNPRRLHPAPGYISPAEADSRAA